MDDGDGNDGKDGDGGNDGDTCFLVGKRLKGTRHVRIWSHRISEKPCQKNMSKPAPGTPRTPGAASIQVHQSSRKSSGEALDGERAPGPIWGRSPPPGPPEPPGLRV